MRSFLNISILSLLLTLVFLGCKKNKDNVFSEYDEVDLSTKAMIKVNYNVAFYNDPFVQIKINDVRVSGTNVRSRFPFPGGGFNTFGGSTGDYLPIAAGPNTKISVSIPKKGTNIDSINVYTTSVATVAGKRYSLHVADSLNRKGLFIDEDFELPDSGFVKMRFVNLIANAPFIDLYNGTNLVAANIPFMGISDKFLISTGTTAAPASTVWTIRAGGSGPTGTVIATYTSGSTILNRRIYTAFATGYTGYPTSGSDLRKPYVAFYYVR